MSLLYMKPTDKTKEPEANKAPSFTDTPIVPEKVVWEPVPLDPSLFVYIYD